MKLNSRLAFVVLLGLRSWLRLDWANDRKNSAPGNGAQAKASPTASSDRGGSPQNHRAHAARAG